MATKVFGCLICVFVLLVLFSPDCHAFGNGAGMAVPGKRTLERRTMRVGITISKKHKGRRVVLILNTCVEDAGMTLQH